MASDAEFIEGVGAVIVADIKTMVAKRLREEYLHKFVRLRNELLQLDRPDDSETMRLLRRPYLQDVEKQWDRALQTLRSELPTALDQLFRDLQSEFQEATGLPVSSAEPRTTALPVSTETRGAINRTPEPKSAPALGVSKTTSPTSNRARSVTLAPNAAVVEEGEAQSTAIERSTPVLDSTNERSNKRVLDPEEPDLTIISKKAKKTPQTHNKTTSFRFPIKRSLLLRDVKEGECIFSHDGYSGVYILRCSLVKCKKRLKQDGPITFTSHPFRDGLAFEHFDGEGHSIESEEEIFRRFAIRVTDACIERNTEKRDDSVFESSCSEVDLASPPVSPKKSKDKGKKPERPYNLSSPRKPEASTSESASKTSETFIESFYRAGPLLAMADSILASENDIDLPGGANGKE